MFTEDDVKFVNEYMASERERRGPVNFKFILMEKLIEVPILVIDKSNNALPSTLRRDLDVGSAFDLKCAGYDDLPVAAFGVFASGLTNNFFDYKINLTFEHAVQHLRGFKEFVTNAGFGKLKCVSIHAEVNTKPQTILINNPDPLFGSW